MHARSLPWVGHGTPSKASVALRHHSRGQNGAYHRAQGSLRGVPAGPGMPLRMGSIPWVLMSITSSNPCQHPASRNPRSRSDCRRVPGWLVVQLIWGSMLVTQLRAQSIPATNPRVARSVAVWTVSGDEACVGIVRRMLPGLTCVPRRCSEMSPDALRSHDLNVVHMTYAELRSGLLDGSLRLYSKLISGRDLDEVSVILLGVAGYMYGDTWGLRGNVHFAIRGETSTIDLTDSFAKRLARDKGNDRDDVPSVAVRQDITRRGHAAASWGYPYSGCDLEGVLGTTMLGNKRVAIVDIYGGVARCSVELQSGMEVSFGALIAHLVRMVSVTRDRSERLENSQKSIPRTWLRDALPRVFEECSPLTRDTMGGLFKLGTIPSDMRNTLDDVMEWYRDHEGYLIWNSRSRWFQVDERMLHARLPPGNLETLDVMLTRLSDPMNGDEARAYLERYARGLTPERLQEVRTKSGFRLEFTECEGYRWRIGASAR